MGNAEKLPNYTVLAALQLVRGQVKRREAYNAMVQDIIYSTGTSFVDTKNRKGEPIRAYLPHAKGGKTDTTADKAAALEQLERLPDVITMRAIDAALQCVGSDIADSTTREAVRRAVELNCTDGRQWGYEHLYLPGISRRDFYRRRRNYLEDVAKRLHLG